LARRPWRSSVVLREHFDDLVAKTDEGYFSDAYLVFVAMKSGFKWFKWFKWYKWFKWFKWFK
jgi:hypothetical protein